MISLVSFNPNSKAVSSDVNSNFQNISNAIRPLYSFGLDEVLTTGTNKTFAVPVTHTSLTLLKVYATVKTAPVGANIILDINKNGTSIWSSNQANRLNIAAGATSGTQTSFDTTTFAENDLLTFDIDQVGSTTSGTTILVIMKFEHN